MNDSTVRGKYVYESPLQRGYVRVKVTWAQHKEIFKVRKIRRWDRGCYYYNGQDVIVEHLTARWFLALMIIPHIIIAPLIMGIPKAIKELKRGVCQRKSGSFGSDGWRITPSEHDPDEQPIIDSWLRQKKGGH